MRFPFTPRATAVALVGAAVIVAAFLLARTFGFDSSGVIIAIEAPAELDLGTEADVRVLVTNNTGATLHDGTIALDLPSEFTLQESAETTFETLAPRAQTAASFRVRVMGDAGTSGELVARARFQPRQLSAVFTREAKTSVRLRELPLDLSFSFPADASDGKPLTFFLRFSSRAEAPIGPVGLTLLIPEGFRVTRTRPAEVPDAGGLWDFGMLETGRREEIAVTGTFSAGSAGGEFTARIGFLDEGRRSLSASREVREYLNLRAGAVPLDVVYREQENPAEALVAPGENVDLVLHYRNATSEPLEDLSVLLAFAHEAIVPESVSSPERFTRSVSGEFVWAPENVLALQRVGPGASGEIAFRARLSSDVPMRSFEDDEQTITVRARTISGGRVLGERRLVLKIVGELAVDAEVRYFDAPGGNNRGSIPPKVGQQTSYTVTLTVTGGTNGLENVVARVVLGPAVTYEALLTSGVGDVVYDPATSEVQWTVGDVPAGVGILSSPKSISFRIVLTPRQEDVGDTAELLTAVSATGLDTFVSQTLDAQDAAVDSTVPDDTKISPQQGIVQP